MLIYAASADTGANDELVCHHGDVSVVAAAVYVSNNPAAAAVLLRVKGRQEARPQSLVESIRLQVRAWNHPGHVHILYTASSETTALLGNARRAAPEVTLCQRIINLATGAFVSHRVGSV